MKRVSANSYQSRLVGGEARIKYRHQSLLQGYLELQKEFVSRKKKLQSASQKRETLLAEVRFLRRRHSYLLKMQSPKTETENFLHPDIRHEQSAKEMNFNVNETVQHNNTGILVMKPISGSLEHEEEMKKETIRVPLRLQKKSKNCLINGKRVGKKKISMQDQVVLEV